MWRAPIRVIVRATFGRRGIDEQHQAIAGAVRAADEVALASDIILVGFDQGRR